MCYDNAYLTKRSLQYAKRVGYSEDTIAELQKRFDELKHALGPHFHATGFAHNSLPVITNEEPQQVYAFRWGLIPFWTKTDKDAQKIENRTLNARGESIFSKPAYRAAAKYRRCLVITDGFYEHHHHKSKTYPYHIRFKSGEPMVMAGLWEEWNNEQGETLFTVSIVTTRANAPMEKIHNNPKIPEPRMPAILNKDEDQLWLDTELPKDEVEKLIKPFPGDALEYYPVSKLRGKAAVGNVEEAMQPQKYPELEEQELF